MNQYRPMLSMPPVVKNLIIINVLFLLGTFVIGDRFGVDLDHLLGLHFFKSEYFRPHQIITHMFMHGGFLHLLFNMYMLYMFGRALENVWGSKRFLTYYLVTGIGAAALHTFVGWLDYSSMVKQATAFANTPSPELFMSFVKDHYGTRNIELMNFIGTWSDMPDNESFINQANVYIQQIINLNINIPTVGASGAVFGVLLAFGMLFPNTELMLLFPPIPIKAKYMVILAGVFELVLGVQNQSGDNIAHFAHLGGMLFGFILIKYWAKNSRNFY